MNTRGAITCLIIATTSAAALAGCSGGSPLPQPTATSQTTTPSTTSNANSTGLAALDPCTLISDQDASSLHITKTGPRKSPNGHGKACGWAANGNVVGAANAYTVGIYTDLVMGLKNLNNNGFQVQPVTLPSHQGQQAYQDGGCDVSIGITDSSLAQVVVIGVNSSQLCALANEYAKLIEPRLPTS